MSLTEKQCKHKNHIGERVLPVLSFNHRGDSWQSYCKVCQRDYSKTHYGENKDYYAKKRDSWRKQTP